MQVCAVLQWTATIILLSSGYGHCQSTYDEERSSCVYSFVVPGSQAEGRCPGRGQSMEMIRLKESLIQLQQDVEQMKLGNAVLQAKNEYLQSQITGLMKHKQNRNQETGRTKGDSTGGVVYVRWGRKTCPGNASLLYAGIAGGAHYTHKGGGANYQCLPRNPQWGEHTDGLASGTYMYGGEYEFPPANSPFLKTNFAGNLIQNNVPCAVCHVTERHVKVMVPARKQCPDGWTREYGGYLTTSHHQHHRATFECMDEAPEVIEGAGTDQNGALFYTVEGDCGYALPCPNYIEGWALTCVVCTK